MEYGKGLLLKVQWGGKPDQLAGTLEAAVAAVEMVEVMVPAMFLLCESNAASTSH